MKKHILSMLIYSILLAGCSAEEEAAKTEFIDDFLIMGFWGPPLEELSLERYKEVAASGIDILVQANGIVDAPTNLKIMDLAQEAGIKILPSDARINIISSDPQNTVDTDIVKHVVSDYKDHPAFAGYVMKGEPHVEFFPLLRTINEAFRAEDPEHEPYFNLLPSYGTIQQLGVEDYRNYIRSFIETVKPRVLSYDNYPLRLNTTLYEAWYNDLHIVREETLKAGIPFRVFILCEGIREGIRLPNRAEILWQVNSAIAYGTQGFGWFSYWTPPTVEPPEGIDSKIVETHHDAMINIRGERTPIYYYVREANEYIKKVGDDLLSWESEEVARYVNGKLYEGSSSFVEIHVEGGIILGTFRKDNQKRIIISNASCEKEALVTLKPAKGWELSGLVTSIEALTNGQKGDLNSWELKAGGSVVIDLKEN